jgi:hypothetical protein
MCERVIHSSLLGHALVPIEVRLKLLFGFFGVDQQLALCPEG